MCYSSTYVLHVSTCLRVSAVSTRHDWNQHSENVVQWIYGRDLSQLMATVRTNIDNGAITTRPYWTSIKVLSSLNVLKSLTVSFRICSAISKVTSRRSTSPLRNLHSNRRVDSCTSLISVHHWYRYVVVCLSVVPDTCESAWIVWGSLSGDLHCLLVVTSGWVKWDQVARSNHSGQTAISSSSV